MILYRLGRTMKYIGFIAALAAGVAACAPANATDLSFISTLTAASSPDFCVLGSCKLKATNRVNAYGPESLALGDSFNFFLGNVSVTPGAGFDNDASLDLTLAFTQPVVGSDGTSAGVKYFHAGGRILPGVTVGSIDWLDNAYSFSIDDYDFELDLQDVSGWNIGSSLALYGTLKLTGIPQGAVPEPASWALMLGGFGLIGSAMRANRKTIVHFA
jgi:hypothetical protein